MQLAKEEGVPILPSYSVYGTMQCWSAKMIAGIEKTKGFINVQYSDVWFDAHY